jgi:hypothetical protein
VADKLVFVSCGQWSPEEKALGKTVAERISAVPGLVGYFAENQSTLDGLTTEILGKLHVCSAFVGIMHHRGTVSTRRGEIIRASVWIEQEIAIAAYRKQVLKKDVAVKLFVQKGISLEGIREKLGINPVIFESDEQILLELNDVLNLWSHSLKPKEPETLSERIEQFMVERRTVTVRGEHGTDSRAKMFGNKRWNGENECQIEKYTEGYVTFRKLDSSTLQTIPLKYLSESWDDVKHRPLFLVAYESY